MLPASPMVRSGPELRSAREDPAARLVRLHLLGQPLQVLLYFLEVRSHQCHQPLQSRRLRLKLLDLVQQCR
jgi:hypothetical protein